MKLHSLKCQKYQKLNSSSKKGASTHNWTLIIIHTQDLTTSQLKVEEYRIWCKYEKHIAFDLLVFQAQRD